MNHNQVTLAIPSSLGPIVCSPVSGELATVDRGTTRYQVLIRSRSSLQRAQTPVCRWRYWHWTIGHRGRWGGVRWLHGSEHHTGIIMDTGTGEGVSWPAGDCTHQSLDFFSSCCSSQCRVEGGSVYPRGDYKVSSRPHLPLLWGLFIIFQRNYSPALTRVYFIFSAPADWILMCSLLTFLGRWDIYLLYFFV